MYVRTHASNSPAHRRRTDDSYGLARYVELPTKGCCAKSAVTISIRRADNMLAKFVGYAEYASCIIVMSKGNSHDCKGIDGRSRGSQSPIANRASSSLRRMGNGAFNPDDVEGKEGGHSLLHEFLALYAWRRGILRYLHSRSGPVEMRDGTSI